MLLLLNLFTPRGSQSPNSIAANPFPVQVDEKYVNGYDNQTRALGVQGLPRSSPGLCAQSNLPPLVPTHPRHGHSPSYLGPQMPACPGSLFAGPASAAQMPCSLVTFVFTL